MRPSLIVLAALTLAVQASWFSGSAVNREPAFNSWNADELKAWLQVHNVPLTDYVSEADLRKAVKENWNTASAWTYDQYYSAQKSFADLRDTTFDSWDESKLRQFLLEHGIVAPKGPKEYLAVLARQKYNAYTTAASSFSSMASASASSAIYGSKEYRASKSLESLAAHATGAVVQATKEVANKFDDSKDYVYSTWDENQMRSWLVKKGLLKSKEQKTKEQLVQMMHASWGRVANPVWEAWSDSYIRHWLIQHHVIKPETTVSTREYLTQNMKVYYYSTSDAVYDAWSDSDLKKWLVDHGVVKSDAQITREKMLKMIQSYYISANDTFWAGWSDSQIRSWLVEHSYLRSDAQVKRDELVKLANEKWSDANKKTAAYLAWPDARLRAYLREHGVDEAGLPSDRPGLLQETRVRWLQSQTRAETLLVKIKEVINSGIYKAEDTLFHLMALLSGGWEDTKDRSADVYEKAKDKAGEGKGFLEKKASETRDWAQEKINRARETTGEKMKVGGEKLKGEL